MWKCADCFPRSTDKICHQKNGIRRCPRGNPADFGPVLLFRHAINATADNGPNGSGRGLREDPLAITTFAPLLAVRGRRTLPLLPRPKIFRVRLLGPRYDSASSKALASLRSRVSKP